MVTWSESLNNSLVWIIGWNNLCETGLDSNRVSLRLGEHVPMFCTYRPSRLDNSRLTIYISIMLYSNVVIGVY